MADIEARRLNATLGLGHDHRAAYGQFFTPQTVARFMASLFDFDDVPIELLDPGAGIGSLTAAFAHAAGKRKIHASCFEIDAHFQSDLRKTLQDLPNVNATVLALDFIEATVRKLTLDGRNAYTHVIANPPYKKIGTTSLARRLVSKLGLETSNLYAAFMACAIAQSARNAQIVAIVPRSFMNGPYFKAFRYWLLDRVALVRIHLFDRRDMAFADDKVLQENVILKMVAGGEQGNVVVSSSADDSFADLHEHVLPFDEIVTPGDADLFIHVPAPRAPRSLTLKGGSLQELDIDVCTGPVVDFRLREHLQSQPLEGSVPMLYAAHFSGGLQWPRDGRKPNAISVNAQTRSWLMPNGCYVVTRRFTSKEEKRRIVAHVLPANALPGERLGFENHLNVFHRSRHGLPESVAKGLCAYLNSQAVDDYFRTFSGHTQVNATDLRRLKYPSISELEAMANV
ncbi:MAG TPA: Eco57I restriction-modification methylase domain-containing protein [Rudaea sp.]|uniref:Eco57I restriction-modification methylase domain-containing protein n=1 Tax=Rudaea sp. TaxID=2136325 RepID=UPI002F91CACB